MRDCLAVIPALNEERTVGAVVDGLRALRPVVDVVVVDDGSRDRTAGVAAAAGARVLSHPFNLGYGAALQTGYKYALREGYAYLVQIDADGQHDPGDVPRLFDVLRRGEADVALGSRFAAESNYHMDAIRRFGRDSMRRLLIALGGPTIADPTSGFQAFARPAFTFCCEDFYPTDFPDIDVLLLLHRHGFRIAEVAVRMAPNPPARIPMHAGLGTLYYSYKMLLATLRSATTTRRAARP